ncbi:MAG: phosphate-starvation-inducible PsiE family protein [Nitrosomonadales bacterium]|nr:phosphate-starvation-inducible PsiE family protein [Nitrosomonadales bacterium]
MREKASQAAIDFGQKAISSIEFVGLIVIAIGTVVAMVQDILVIAGVGKVTLGDLLLMFLYLEILLMVRHYLVSGKFPVRYHLFIGMVALARYLILDIKEMDSMRMLQVAGAIFILGLAVLVIRIGQNRFPSIPEDDNSSGHK